MEYCPGLRPRAHSAALIAPYEPAAKSTSKPDTLEINVPRVDGGFTIVQPDMLRSPDPTNPTVFYRLALP